MFAGKPMVSTARFLHKSVRDWEQSVFVTRLASDGGNVVT
jgi:hypothetical protein